MPFSLSLFLYKQYQHQVQKAFAENNKVLSHQDIENLLKDPDRARTLRILCSAVGSHEKVEGYPFYLSSPVNAIFSHDMFKRALIADELGAFVNGLNHEEISDIIFILRRLTFPEDNSGYVQLLAWNSLGKITAGHPDLYETQVPEAARAFGGSVPTLIGGLLYCDSLRESRQGDTARELFQQGWAHVQFRFQKVLMCYYFTVNFHGERMSFKMEESIMRFVDHVIQDKALTHSDLMGGLREIGFFQQFRDLTFWENTPHEDIGKRLIRAARLYLMIVGGYAGATR